MTSVSYPLPWETLDASSGFSFEMGESGMTLLYIDKNDWKEPSQREQGSMGQVKVKTFQSKSFTDNEVSGFIKTHVHTNNPDGTHSVIHGTGMDDSILTQGTNFNVQSKELASCFALALPQMLKLPRRDVVHTFDAKDEQKILESGKSIYQATLQYKGMLKIRTKDEEPLPESDLWFVKQDPQADLDKPMTAEQDMFPCLLVNCGSTFTSNLVYEDGTYDRINGSPLGDKFWVGVSSLLNDAKSYEELMELAEKGKPGPIHMAQHDFAEMVPETTEKLNDGNLYEEMLDMEGAKHVRTVFSFGKVNPQNKDELKPEDLTRAFLEILVSDTVVLAMTAARIARVRHVYFTGVFVGHPLVKKLLKLEWVKNWAEKTALDKSIPAMEAHFIQHERGSHLGALGAFLKNN